ncbi:hypothetical protein NDU88_000397 [Pleurodeles waltl]|uniref:Uncharacterized protein n=1 Tax=Pleurodeles waltl TaxID=8319 RepID=A0AAV7P866_PLEWA|nr:hypothetical protein NDU88_000397 [Pleurodeles waltl]
MHGVQLDDLSCRSDQMAGPQGHKGSPGALASGARRQRPGWGLPPQGLPEPWPGASELKPEGKASLGLTDSQAQAPQGTGGWRMGAPAPGPGRGQGPGAQSKLSEHSHALESSPDPVPGALPPGRLEGESQDRGSHTGACRGP